MLPPIEEILPELQPEAPADPTEEPDPPGDPSEPAAPAPDATDDEDAQAANRAAASNAYGEPMTMQDASVFLNYLLGAGS